MTTDSAQLVEDGFGGVARIGTVQSVPIAALNNPGQPWPTVRQAAPESDPLSRFDWIDRQHRDVEPAAGLAMVLGSPASAIPADVTSWLQRNWRPGELSRSAGRLAPVEWQDGEFRTFSRAQPWHPPRQMRRQVLPTRPGAQHEVTAYLRFPTGPLVARNITDLRVSDLQHALPMRDFSRRKGQRHKPVSRYSQTTGHLVPAESQHEGRFVVLADHHPDVEWIAAQPFTMQWPSSSTTAAMTHTPDFVLLARGRPPLVVDVKWPKDAFEATTITKLSAVRDALAAAGMYYVVWVGIADRAVRNLRLFAAARVSSETARRWSPTAIAAVHPSAPCAAVVRALDEQGLGAAASRTLIRALLWRRQLFTDLNHQFGDRSVLHTTPINALRTGQQW